MTTTPIAVVRFDPLQPPDAKCYGVVGAVDGGGVLFLLLKDDTHHWGLWQRVPEGITPLLVPLPGGKHEADASMVILDGKVMVYLAARIGTDPRPAHECEVIVPHAKRAPGMAHVSAIYREIAVVKNNLSARLVEIERALGNQSEEAPSAALEKRVEALEGRQKVAGLLGSP